MNHVYLWIEKCLCIKSTGKIIYSESTSLNEEVETEIKSSVLINLDSEFHSIDKIMTTLRSSSKSRFFSREKIVCISYSRYEGSNGKIKQLYEQFKDAPYAYVRKIPSWIFNPNPNYTRASLNNEFAENPQKAKTIYECEPGDGYIDSWIKDGKRIEAAMPRSFSWIFDMPVPTDHWKKEPWAEHEWESETGQQFKLNPYKIPIKFTGIAGVKYVLVGDPGLGSEKTGGDAYGVAMAHREWVVNEYGNRHPKTVIDFAFRFTGMMFAEGQVQMAAIEDLVYNLKDNFGYDISVLSFDGWNSITTTQNIKRKYPSMMLHARNIVTLEHYSILRDIIFGENPPTSGEGRKEDNGGVLMPYHPILLWELQELREDRGESGKMTKLVKITHESSSHNDISDCVAMAAYICVKSWPFAEVVTAAGGRARTVAENKLSEGTSQRMEEGAKIEEALKRKMLETQMNLKKEESAKTLRLISVAGLGKFSKGR
jgi:hypothetical protein